MNRIYKVVWNAARGCYVVGSELISCHSREKSGRLAKIKISALILGAVCGFSLSSLPSICAAENVQHEEIAAETAKYDEKTAEAILLRLTGRANRNVEQKSTADTAELKENTDEEALKAANSEPQPEETTTLADGTLAQHSTHDENGYYVHNGDTYNSLTKDGLWVGGTDDSSGFHVDKDGNVTTTGTAQFKQGASTGGNKITDVADGKIEADSTDAVNGGQLAAYVAGELNYTGEGAVSVKDRTISVNTGEGLSVDEDELTLALKENGNLVFDTDGNLTLKDSITVGAVNIDSVKIDDNTVTGLSNTAWTGDNIVNDRATTEGQLKQALENLDLNDISMTVDGEERSLQSVGIIPGSTEKSDQTYAKEAIAIGHSATATGDYSTALGSATANGDYSTALGPEAKANKNYSMALGYGSVADEENVISVGNTNQYRRIVNVADGTGEHEAVTFGQMNTLISGNRTSSDINLDNGATNLVDGINKNTSAIEQLDKSNEITWDNLQTATQNVDNLTQKVSAFAAQTENVDWNALNSVDWGAVSAYSRTAVMPMALSTENLPAANNTMPLADDETVSDRPAPDGLEDVTHDTNGYTFDTDVTIKKDLTVGGTATFKQEAVFEKGASMQDELKMNDNKITGLKEGDISEGSKDAVNGGQIFTIKNELQEGIDNNASAINQLGRSIYDLDNRVDQVGANAAALAGLHPLDYDPDNKLEFAVGYGNYRSADAVAVGAFYHPDENVMVSLGGATGGGEDMINLGVSFKIGSGADSVTTSRTAMARELSAMKEIVTQQDEQLAMQKQQLAEQEEKIKQLEAMIKKIADEKIDEQSA